MTYIVTVEIEAPPGQGVGIKEDLAMQLEKHGITRVVEVREIREEQIKMEV